MIKLQAKVDELLDETDTANTFLEQLPKKSSVVIKPPDAVQVQPTVTHESGTIDQGNLIKPQTKVEKLLDETDTANTFLEQFPKKSSVVIKPPDPVEIQPTVTDFKIEHQSKTIGQGRLIKPQAKVEMFDGRNTGNKTVNMNLKINEPVIIPKQVLGPQTNQTYKRPYNPYRAQLSTPMKPASYPRSTGLHIQQYNVNIPAIARHRHVYQDKAGLTPKAAAEFSNKRPASIVVNTVFPEPEAWNRCRYANGSFRTVSSERLRTIQCRRKYQSRGPFYGEEYGECFAIFKGNHFMAKETFRTRTAN